MKVFFTSSPRGLDTHHRELKTIFRVLESLGHEHLSDLVINNDVPQFYRQSKQDWSLNYQSLTNRVKKADFVIAEVSCPSLAIGYLINFALEKNKPVIALYSQNHVPYFLIGLENQNFHLFQYSENSIVPVLTEAFEYVSDELNIRFNMIFPAKINQYLEEISLEQGISKSHFIRSLIKKHMQENPITVPGLEHG